MTKPDRFRVAAGLAFWIGVAVAAALGVFTPRGSAADAADRLVAYAVSSPRHLVLDVPQGAELRPGDPVFVSAPDRFLVRVGRVESTGGGAAVLALHPEAEERLREGLVARVYAVPDTVAWIVATLLPRAKTDEIRSLTVEFFRREGEAIRAALMPELEESVREVVAFYEEELPAALARHADEIEALATKHREGVIRRDLVPVVKEVGGKLAAEKFRPLAEEVGREIMDSLPVWSLGWRYLWEKVPFTDDQQMKKRFEKYFREEAEPILAAHTDEAVRLLGEVLKEMASDPRVRAAVRRVATEVAEDPEVAALAKELFSELVLRNERLVSLLRKRWEEGLRDAVASAASRTEPLVKDIVNAVVKDADGEGLSPRFAHVLRTRVFWKDRRWVLLVPGDGGAPLTDGARIPAERPRD